MARITEALLNGKMFHAGAKTAMLDITYGGQLGWAPNAKEWVSNQAYIRHNVECILLEAPRFFSLMPDPNKWYSALKALVELHPRTIEGLNSGLTVATDDHPIGGANEVQSEITNVTRERSIPVFTFVEKYGRPIQRLLQYWIEYGLMSPETKYSLIGTLDTAPEDMLADWFTMTCLFYEPDATHRKVEKSWVTANMFPTSTGEIIGRRDLTSPSEITTISVEFPGFSQSNLGTDLFAQKILDSINMRRSNPHLAPSFINEIHSDVAAANNTGIKRNIEELGRTAVQ